MIRVAAPRGRVRIANETRLTSSASRLRTRRSQVRVLQGAPPHFDILRTFALTIARVLARCPFLALFVLPTSSSKLTSLVTATP